MTAKKKHKRLSPIQELKREKGRLARECAAQEKVFEEQWHYLSSNLGGLIIQNAADSVLAKVGLGPKKKEANPSQEEKKSGMALGIGSKIFNGMVISAPILWNIVQPMVMSAVGDKVMKFLFPNKEEGAEEEPVKKKSRRWRRRNK